MSALLLPLEARAPALRCHRAYEIAVAHDLFGVWIAEMTYGRIGTAGRTKSWSFTCIEDAASAVDASLRRRATLPRRLGAAYRLRSIEFEPGWKIDGLSEWLTGFMDKETGGSLLGMLEPHGDAIPVRDQLLGDTGVGQDGPRTPSTRR